MTGILLVCCRTDAVVGVFCERRKGGLQRDELAREPLHRCHVGCRPANLDLDVAALQPSKLPKAIPERSDEGVSFRIALGICHQHANPSHALRLLRVAPRAAMPLPRLRAA